MSQTGKSSLVSRFRGQEFKPDFYEPTETCAFRRNLLLMPCHTFCIFAYSNTCFSPLFIGITVIATRHVRGCRFYDRRWHASLGDYHGHAWTRRRRELPSRSTYFPQNMLFAPLDLHLSPILTLLLPCIQLSPVVSLG